MGNYMSAPLVRRRLNRLLVQLRARGHAGQRMARERLRALCVERRTPHWPGRIPDRMSCPPAGRSAQSAAASGPLAHVAGGSSSHAPAARPMQLTPASRRRRSLPSPSRRCWARWSPPRLPRTSRGTRRSPSRPGRPRRGRSARCSLSQLRSVCSPRAHSARAAWRTGARLHFGCEYARVHLRSPAMHGCIVLP